MKLRPKHPANVKVDPTSRRMFLKSAGGLTLALPLLPSLLTAISEKAVASADVPLRYVGIINNLGGLQNKNWMGTQLPAKPFEMYPGRNGMISPLSSLVTASNGLSPVLDSSFNNVFPMMNLIAGVDQPANQGHNNWVAVGAFADSMVSRPGIVGNFPSIDQVMGYSGPKQKGLYNEALAGRRRFLNISTGGPTSSWGRDDYGALSSPVEQKDILDNNAGIFSYLFGNVSPGNMSTGTVTDNPLLNLVNEFWPSGKDILKYLSNDDRASVDQLFSLAQSAADDYSYPTPVINISGKPPGTDSGYDTVAGQNALADIISMAFKCDITRIVTMWLGHTVNGYYWHGMTHAPESGNYDSGQPQLVEIHQNISRNLVSRLANNMLDVDPFGNGTSLLNNSMIMWSAEDKCAHHMYGLPTLLMGAAGGRIKTGNFVDLRNFNNTGVIDYVGDMQYRGDLINRLWASLFYSLNISRSEYEVARGGGDSLSIALNKGYGHVFSPKSSWSGLYPDYDVSKVGEPWEFLTKSSTIWG